MTTGLNSSLKQGGSVRMNRSFFFGVLGLLALFFAAGCETPPPVVASESNSSKQETSRPQEVITVKEGDTLRIAFPGTASLDTTQQVRSDGRITLSIIGELRVVGMTPAELEAELVKQYSSQLLSKEVSVTVVSSTFDVYVTGAVVHPGRLTSNKPITAFQAIMESGGFDSARANTQKVLVIRDEGGAKYSYFSLNLELILQGKQTEPFYLKPSDTVQVPEKLTLF